MDKDFTLQTRQQQWAQAAFGQIDSFLASHKIGGKLPEKLPEVVSAYRSFVRSFPALIRECGLAQAIAFAEHKNKPVLEHLEAILGKNAQMADLSRTEPLDRYIVLSQQTLDAACWLKRYAEALIPVDQEN